LHRLIATSSRLARLLPSSNLTSAEHRPMTLHRRGFSLSAILLKPSVRSAHSATEPPATSSPKLRQRFTDRESPNSARSRNASHASSRRAAKLFVLIRAWGARGPQSRAQSECGSSSSTTIRSWSRLAAQFLSRIRASKFSRRPTEKPAIPPCSPAYPTRHNRSESSWPVWAGVGSPHSATQSRRPRSSYSAERQSGSLVRRGEISRGGRRLSAPRNEASSRVSPHRCESQ
jgi:hypothetical protein